MERMRTSVCALVLAASALAACETLKIASFNVQVFGQKKFSRPEVVGVLRQIVGRYDIILIQEIRDASETVIHEFTAIVNNGSGELDMYGVVVSERLGRTNSKEQYAFMYRSSVVDVIATYQHNDSDDVFEREPYSVQFRTRAGNEEFFLVGIHVRPSDVIGELEALGPAFDQVSLFYGNSRGAIMGDLNAGCSYLSMSRYEELSLVNDPSFIWLLGYDADTTVARSSCPYDRIIVHSSLNGSVVHDSVSVFNYTDAYSLTAVQATNVSDHFPVEFQLDFKSQDSNIYSSMTPPTATPTSTPGDRSNTQASAAHAAAVLPLTTVVMTIITMLTSV